MDNKNFNRRNFIISLGKGTAVCIGGFFLMKNWPDTASAEPNLVNSSSFPQLRNDIFFGKYNDMDTISYKMSDDNVTCGFNQPGNEIIKKLDGHHTIEQIANSIVEKFDIKDSKSFNAKIAYFVAQLGILGFLHEPFYTNIFYKSVEIYE